MYALIASAFGRARTVMLLLAMILTGGLYAYITVPKEAVPEFKIPYFIIDVVQPGISARDSARLLVEPLERQLQTIDGLRKITARAGEGFALVTVEFEPGSDQQEALQQVRDEVDNAGPDLPAGAEAPNIREIDLSIFPILTVALSGDIPERELIRLARELEERLETLSGVLEARLSGDREDLLEVIIDPLAVQSYGISTTELVQAIQGNNRLITAGAVDSQSGRIAVSVPGTIQSPEDVLNIPLRATDTGVVRVRDVAEVRQTFRDPVSFARIDGQSTIALDISKTSGANIIDTVARVKSAVAEMRRDWPRGLQASYLQNQAEDIEELLSDLQNNVIAAVLLVALTIILTLGLRASLLVAIAIPGAFLCGVMVIAMLGYTLNMVVLFGLILVIGMLVDGAIVVVERARRLQDEGVSQSQAFLQASQRMSWPIITSTATTLAVFAPLLFWPGIAGQFMFYLPATVIITLLASLLMALFFVPVAGSLFFRKSTAPAPQSHGSRYTALYDRQLRYLIQRPGFALGLSLLLLLAAFFLYSLLGRGVNFFPAVEPERAQVQIQASGNLSVRGADRLVRLVEDRIIGQPGVERLYARTIGTVEARLAANVAPDVIGTLQIDFTDWRQRPPAAVILERIRSATADLPGLGIQIEEQLAGPGDSRPVQVRVSSDDRQKMTEAANQLRQKMAQQPGLTDVGSDVPVPLVELRLNVDREKAARQGVNIESLGNTLQLLTNGVLLGSYLPDFAPEEVDIRLRYPADERSFSQLTHLRIPTRDGQVPITQFVTLEPGPAHSVINRVDGRNVQTLSASLATDTTVTGELAKLRRIIDELGFDEAVDIEFAGEIEDQQEAAEFLLVAFVAAIFLILLVLLTQLNSFFQSGLVLSAIVFSLAGVLLGLTLRQEPFSIVMSGIGVMALAGIVVNNNIVLIDAYNEYFKSGLAPDEAAWKAGMERLRPVLLTAVTTIIGLMPMVLGMTVDFTGREIYFGAPSGQFWIQLATAIVGGLAIATFITILLTPTMLAWNDNRQREPAGSD
ncbi:MAG: efflux RND transporter permease subunit [Pseudomonadota bacterium]